MRLPLVRTLPSLHYRIAVGLACNPGAIIDFERRWHGVPVAVRSDPAVQCRILLHALNLIEGLDYDAYVRVQLPKRPCVFSHRNLLKILFVRRMAHISPSFAADLFEEAAVPWMKSVLRTRALSDTKACELYQLILMLEGAVPASWDMTERDLLFKRIDSKVRYAKGDALARAHQVMRPKAFPKLHEKIERRLEACLSEVGHDAFMELDHCSKMSKSLRLRYAAEVKRRLAALPLGRIHDWVARATNETRQIILEHLFACWRCVPAYTDAEVLHWQISRPAMARELAVKKESGRRRKQGIEKTVTTAAKKGVEAARTKTVRRVKKEAVAKQPALRSNG